MTPITARVERDNSTPPPRSIRAVVLPLVAAALFFWIGFGEPIAFIGAVICLAAFVVESDVRALDSRIFILAKTDKQT